MIHSPNYFVIGAGRCGTTALSEILRQHPDVFVTSPKEPHFLALAGTEPRFEGPGDDLMVNNTAAVTIDAYLAMYKRAGGKAARGDASVSSLYYADAALKTMTTHFPDAKVIAMLREPAARAYSAFSYLRMRHFEPCASFAAALDEEASGARRAWQHLWQYVDMGRYAQQLIPWLERLGAERVLVLYYDDFVRDPTSSARQVFRHLEVSDSVAFSADLVNMSGKPRSASAQRAIRWVARTPRARSMVQAALPYRIRERIKRLNIREDRMPDTAVDRLTRIFDPEMELLREVIATYYGSSAVDAAPAWLRDHITAGVRSG